MGSDSIYLSHREVIDRTVGIVCRRHRLSAFDADDFSGALHLHLIEHDYAVLRRFEGRSAIRTYLLAVITHYFQDWRNARWGKWRPSAEAKRLGGTAVRLETLLTRDGLTLDEAHETLRTHHGVTESRAALEAIAARFPVRERRTEVPDDTLASRPATDLGPDAPLEHREAAEDAARSAALITAALRALPDQDQLILRMRFEDDLPIVSIARVLRLEQKALYRRLNRLLATLRTQLEAAGVTADQATGILEHRGFDQVALDSAPRRESRRDVRLLTVSRSPVPNAKIE